MDFSIAVPIVHPPTAVQDALLDPDFLAVTATLPKVGGAEVLELSRAADTARLRVRYRFTAPLSRAVTRVIDPAKLTWVDDARFDLNAMRAEHVMLPDNYADRLESSYTSTLAPDGTGTTWTVSGSLTVHAPLVGGKVAGVIVDGLREHAVAQGALLDEWLTRRT
ncbi:MAG: DUF2505 family protein [Acidimicrobiia bacterium]|jgi:hypothetical protein